MGKGGIYGRPQGCNVEPNSSSCQRNVRKKKQRCETCTRVKEAPTMRQKVKARRRY